MAVIVHMWRNLRCRNRCVVYLSGIRYTKDLLLTAAGLSLSLLTHIFDVVTLLSRVLKGCVLATL